MTQVNKEVNISLRECYNRLFRRLKSMDETKAELCRIPALKITASLVLNGVIKNNADYNPTDIVDDILELQPDTEENIIKNLLERYLLSYKENNNE